MTTGEWRAAVAAARPPLTAAQLAILRQLWKTPAQKDAAPDRSETAPGNTQERNTHDRQPA